MTASINALYISALVISALVISALVISALIIGPITYLQSFSAHLGVYMYSPQLLWHSLCGTHEGFSYTISTFTITGTRLYP